MPEIIREKLVKNNKSIVIAGTSGKTTTASLIGWILKRAKFKPTVFVGGIIKNIDSGFINDTGKYVVIEGDEYNSSFYDSCPKFLHYRPCHAIITNIQSDHLDIYRNIENIFQAFKKLIKLVPISGSVVLNKGNQYTQVLIKESKTKVTTFGENGDLEAKHINYSPTGISFELFYHGKKLGNINSPLLGNHNVENIIAAIAIALNIKIPFSKISSAVTNFQGVKRRLEVIYDNNDIKIIDDFAHNPDKVLASLSALRDHFPKHQIVAIFEPRTGSSRRKFFQHIYPTSFAFADIVYIAEPYKKEFLNKKDVFLESKLVKDLVKRGITAYSFANANQIIEHLSKYLRKPIIKPMIIIVMTSGEFEGIHQKLVDLALSHK